MRDHEPKKDATPDFVACKNSAFYHSPTLLTVPIIVALDYPETMQVGKTFICGTTGWDRRTLYCWAQYGEPKKGKNWPDDLTSLAFFNLAKLGPCFWRDFGFNLERKPDGRWVNLIGVPVPDNKYKPMLTRLGEPGVGAKLVGAMFGEKFD